MPLDGNYEHTYYYLTSEDKTLLKLNKASHFATVILRHHILCIDGKGDLFIYKNGKYEQVDDYWVQRQYMNLLSSAERPDKFSKHVVSTLGDIIRLYLKPLRIKPPLNAVNLKNGLWSISKKKLYPHNPDWRHTIQLPIEYNPNARCPAWETFVDEVFPEDAKHVAWQIMAWLMLPILKTQSAIILISSGGSGKSVFLSGLTSFLGHENISAVSLGDLEHHRFSPVELVGKLANICGDIDVNRRLKTTETFKKITGGDRIMVEAKHKRPYDTELFARLLFSANGFPKSPDSSEGWFRRWVPIPFEREFEHKPEVAVELNRRLSDPMELSGCLNKAIEQVDYVLTHGVEVTETMKETLQEYRLITDPILKFIDDYIEKEPGNEVEADTVYKLYLKWVSFDTHQNVLSSAMFGRALKRQLPYLEKVRLRSLEKERGYFYRNIRLKQTDIVSL